MAIIPAVFQRIPTEEGLDEMIATWANAGDGDTFSAVSLPQRADRTFQVFGSFGGGTVVLNGSNDNANYALLNDAFGNAISLTSAAIKQVTESCLWVRPTLSGSTGAAITVVMSFRRVLR